MCAQWLDRVKFGNGHDGTPAVSGTINTYATCTGTATQTSLTTTLSASAGDIILIHQSQGTGAGQWEINQVISDDGSTLTLAYPLAYTYGTGAQVVLGPQYTGGDISGAITGTAWNGSIGGIIFLMSNGDLTISGSISAVEIGFRGGSSYEYTGKAGESYMGVGTNVRDDMSANYSAGGGAQGNNHPTDGKPHPNGGSAGHATSGTFGGYSGGMTGGAAGNTCGTSNLTSLFFGSGGGGTANVNDGVLWSTSTGMEGAKGSGIIVVFAKKLIVTGTISVKGGNSRTKTDSRMGTGGAGSAGSFLAKIESGILGTNKIIATGGEIFSGTTTGGSGYIRVEYSDTITGTTNPTASTSQVTTLKSQIYGGII